MEPKCRKNRKNIFSISRSDKVNHLPLESKIENNSIPAFYFKRATPKSRETCNLCSLPVSEYLFHFLVGVVVKKHVTDDVTVVSTIEHFTREYMYIFYRTLYLQLNTAYLYIPTQPISDRRLISTT